MTLSITGTTFPLSKRGMTSLVNLETRSFLYPFYRLLKVVVKSEALFYIIFEKLQSSIFVPPMVPYITHLASKAKH
jgi:hypothetical protein